MNPILVITTVNELVAAQRIARELVEKRLAACVQIIGPLESVYRWQGQLETAQEWQCQAKTIDSKYAKVEAAIHQAHSYDLPEVISIPITGGSTDYLRWLAEEVQAEAKP